MRSHSIPTLLIILIVSLLFPVHSDCFVFGNRSDMKKAAELSRTHPNDALLIYRNLLNKNLSDEVRQEVHYYVGRLLDRLEQTDEAIHSFQASKSIPRDTDFSIASSIELISLRKAAIPVEVSVEILHESANLKSKDLLDRAYFLIGKARFDAKLYEDALSAFRQAISIRAEISKDAYTLWILSAQCNEQLKKYQDALIDLDRAFDLVSFVDSNAVLGKFRVHIALGQLQIGLELLRDSFSTGSEAFRHSVLEILESQTYNDLGLIKSQAIHSELEAVVLKTRIRKAAELGLREEVEKGLDQLITLDSSHTPDLAAFKREMLEFSYQHDDTVGLLIPLSGELASIGMSIFRGASLAVEAFHETNPDISFKLITKDTQEEIQQIEHDFNRLVQEDQVIALIGPIKSSSGKRVAELANEAEIPVLTPGCPNDTIPALSEFLFRVFPSVEREAFILCHYFISVYQVQRIAVVYPDIEYGQQALTGIQRAVDLGRSRPTEIVFTTSYPESSSNYSSYLAGLKSANPDLIIIPDNGDRAAQLVNHIRYIDIYSVPVAGTGEWQTANLLQIGGSNLENATIINEYPRSSALRESLSNRYISKFGESPDPFALRAFEIINILGQARLSGVKTRLQMKRFLEENPSGLDGPAQFSADGYFLPTMTLFRIEKASFVPVALFSSEEFVPVPPSPTPSPIPQFTNPAM